MPELTAGQSINKALSLILEKNQTAFLAGEDIGIYGGACGVTEGLLEEFGRERIKDTPCLLYTSPSPRDTERSRMPSSA